MLTENQRLEEVLLHPHGDKYSRCCYRGISHLGTRAQLMVSSLFSLAIGSTAGGFSVLRPRFVAAIVGNEGEQDRQSLLIFVVLTASRGAAIVGSGFIMADLVDPTGSKVGYGGGSAWVRLVYTGTIMDPDCSISTNRHDISRPQSFAKKAEAGLHCGRGCRVAVRHVLNSHPA